MKNGQRVPAVSRGSMSGRNISRIKGAWTSVSLANRRRQSPDNHSLDPVGVSLTVSVTDLARGHTLARTRGLRQSGSGDRARDNTAAELNHSVVAAWRALDGRVQRGAALAQVDLASFESATGGGCPRGR